MKGSPNKARGRTFTAVMYSSLQLNCKDSNSTIPNIMLQKMLSRVSGLLILEMIHLHANTVVQRQPTPQAGLRPVS